MNQRPLVLCQYVDEEKLVQGIRTGFETFVPASVSLLSMSLQ